MIIYKDESRKVVGKRNNSDFIKGYNMKRIILFTVAIFICVLVHAQNIVCLRDTVIDGLNYRLYGYETRYGSQSPVKAAVIANDVSACSGDLLIPEVITCKLRRVFFGENIPDEYYDAEFNVTDIEEKAFLNCSGLLSVTLPKTIEFIGNNAFEGCTRLSLITLFGCPTGYDKGGENIFQNCPNFKEVVLDCVGIGGHLFRDVRNLEKVTLTDKVKYINNDVFKECSGLKDIFCYAITPPKVYDAFDSYNVVLHVSRDAFDLYKNHELWNKFEITDFDNTIEYALTYYINGEIFKTVKYNYNDEIMAEPAPTKEGHTFSGWSEIPLKMPGKDVNIYGTFSVNVYKLSYFVDGLEYKSYDIEYGESIVPEAEPAKDNYEFSGWSYIPKTMPAKDLAIIGSFTKVSTDIEDVRYKFVGDEAFVIGNKNKVGEVEILSSFEDEGKIYTVTTIVVEAFRNNTSIISVYLPNTIKIISNRAFMGCKNLKAIEVGDGITIIGERAFANIDKLTDVTILAEEVPTTDRTAFENSYIEDYVTLHVPGSAIKKYKETAPWKNFKEIVAIPGTEVNETYKLTYIVDGEVYKTIDVKEGDAITPEALPTKVGYTFSGWDNVPGTMPAGNVTVTGYFTVNKYTITYYVDGEVYKTVEVEYGSVITPESEPSKEGYNFSGWSWIPSKMPAEDVVVTGSFTKVSYQVGNSTYEMSEDGVTLTRGEDVNGDLVIDAFVTINGKRYKVTVIGEGAFQGFSRITSVTIPDGIESVMADAFEGCSGIMKLVFGKNVRYIGHRAFANASRFVDVRTRAEEERLIVECHSESVPEAEEDCFDNTPIEAGLLLVNDNLFNSYDTTSPWNQFGEIMGFDQYTEYTGVVPAFTDDEGATLFSIDGRKLEKPQKGINIIKTKIGFNKVMLK